LMNAGAIVKAHCGVCHGEKNSWLRAEYMDKNGDGADAWSETYQTVQCCGCDKLSVRHEVWRSEWDEADFDEQGRPVKRRGAKVTYHPAQTVRAKPPGQKPSATKFSGMFSTSPILPSIVVCGCSRRWGPAPCSTGPEIASSAT
jgi:hypothetical protein